MHLVGFIARIYHDARSIYHDARSIYHDARSPERQIGSLCRYVVEAEFKTINFANS